MTGEFCPTDKIPEFSNPTIFPAPDVPGQTFTSMRPTVTFITTDKNPAVVFTTKSPPRFDMPTDGGGLPMSNKKEPAPTKELRPNRVQSSKDHGKAASQPQPTSGDQSHGQPQRHPLPGFEPGSGSSPDAGSESDPKPGSGSSSGSNSGPNNNSDPEYSSRSGSDSNSDLGPNSEPKLMPIAVQTKTFVVTARDQEVIVNDKTFSGLKVDQTTTVTVDHGTFTIRPTEVAGEGVTIKKPQPAGTVVSVVSPTSAILGQVPVAVSGTEASFGGTTVRIPLMGTTMRLEIPTQGSNTLVDEREVFIAPDRIVVDGETLKYHGVGAPQTDVIIEGGEIVTAVGQSVLVFRSTTLTYGPSIPGITETIDDDIVTIGPAGVVVDGTTLGGPEAKAGDTKRQIVGGATITKVNPSYIIVDETTFTAGPGAKSTTKEAGGETITIGPQGIIIGTLTIRYPFGVSTVTTIEAKETGSAMLPAATGTNNNNAKVDSKDDDDSGAAFLRSGLTMEMTGLCIANKQEYSKLRAERRKLSGLYTVQTPCARSTTFTPEFQPFSYMQQESLEHTKPLIQRDNPFETPSSQHGPLHHVPSGLRRVYSGDSSGADTGSAPALHQDSSHDVDADLLDEELRRLSLRHHSSAQPSAPGQRISEYENAMTPPTPKKALGFKVIKRFDVPSGGVLLEDFPNEILTHIFSHLHSDSHAAIALVSKRFYALITSSHAWRMAFLRFFPGHEALEVKNHVDIWSDSSPDLIQSESRYFTRLTPLASWRKEYLLRTRLVRCLARGKPGASVASGGIGASVRSGKKTSAVLTYNSKLPWAVTNVHAVFTNGKKPPKAIHGSADLGVASVSDPTNGRVEKWGFVDPFNAMQLDEVFPNLVPFGLGDGPAATPNVLDVSQPYGVLAGEGFPGGRPYYRPVGEIRGRYLGGVSGVVDTYPDIPKIPEMSEAICSVWLAKSANVPTNTQSMVGMLTGSTLGVVTSYAIGGDNGPQRYESGDVTARWVLSPGVPIIAFKVDDNYSQKRKSTGRIWAVALNALGEVYYLTEIPTTQNQDKSEDATKNAWFAGRSVCWHLLDSTRRVARPDELDKNAIKGAYSPRSPSNSMNLSKSQMAAEAREIEKFLRHKPAHFRRACEGWDMQRKLEVDFANDDGHGAGENIFVLDCGLAEDHPAHIERYTRSLVPQDAQSSSVILAPTPPAPSMAKQASLFGATHTEALEVLEETASGSASPASLSSSDFVSHFHEWKSCSMSLKGQSHAVITSVSIDCSNTAVLTLGEDPLHEAEDEIPGRRSRLFAVGTDDGAVLVWNAREDSKAVEINPVRQIQTESPEVSCVALSAMYLVHGGNDGLVQAWDPLASTLDPVRTLNARSNGRVPRHMMTMNPTLNESTYSAVGAIYLDPDPTVLRGVVSFGAFLRYWAYSSASHASGRKRRLRHTDVHGRLASRRQDGKVTGFIAAEEAEIQRDNEIKAREQNRLRNRFGVGTLGDLTEEEALRYAQMVSEEAFLFEELRRTSDSAADASLDTASTFSETTVDTVTPEPSVTDMITPPSASTDNIGRAPVEDDYEQQIQQAIRLSLMEGVNENGPSPQVVDSGDYEFSLTYKPKSNKKTKASRSVSPGASKVESSGHPGLMDYDLELALKLSMEDQGLYPTEADLGFQYEEFPTLETEGIGKGKDSVLGLRSDAPSTIGTCKGVTQVPSTVYLIHVYSSTRYGLLLIRSPRQGYKLFAQPNLMCLEIGS
ncbi:unnamed protein product [Fusarium graminearum]|nr:unnamed protein product [Fusarium graminearum]